MNGALPLQPPASSPFAANVAISLADIPDDEEPLEPVPDGEGAGATSEDPRRSTALSPVDRPWQRAPLEAVVAALTGRVGRQAGRSIVLACPFPDHQDDTASFHVFPQENTYKCFGLCQRRGDVISFVMEWLLATQRDGLVLSGTIAPECAIPPAGKARRAFFQSEQGKALFRLAADRFRTLDLERVQAAAPPTATVLKPRLRELSQAHRALLGKARDKYAQILLETRTASGELAHADVLSYLLAPPTERPVHNLPGRGLRLEDVLAERIGYCPTGNQLLPYLNPAERALAQDLGLVNERGNERMRGRVIYAATHEGDVEFLEGRFFGSEADRTRVSPELPKYLSPDYKPLLFRDAITPGKPVFVFESLSSLFPFRQVCRILGCPSYGVATVGGGSIVRLPAALPPGTPIVPCLDDDRAGHEYLSQLRAAVEARNARPGEDGGAAPLTVHPIWTTPFNDLGAMPLPQRLAFLEPLLRHWGVLG